VGVIVKELKLCVKLFFMLALFLMASSSINAAQSNLEERVNGLEKENRLLRQMLGDMQKRLDDIEKKQPDGRTEQKKPPASVEKRLDKLETASKEQKNKGLLPSGRGEKIKISGKVEFEYRDVEREENYYGNSTARPEGQFQLDKARLRIDAHLTRDLDGVLKLNAKESNARIKEAYLRWENLPLDSRLRIGLMPRFWRPSRLTESYPLPGTAYWRDRTLGIEWKWKYNPIFGHLAVYNGLPLGERPIGEDDSFPILQDDFNNLDFNQNKDLAAGLGFDQDWGGWGRTDLLLFGSVGKISSEDQDFLMHTFYPVPLPGTMSIDGYPDTEDDDRTRLGVSGRYRWRGLRLFGQYIDSEDGALDRDGWYTEASYKFSIPEWKYFHSLRPLLRYSELNVDTQPNPFQPLSWDREQWTLALISEVHDNVILKAEYNWNDENTGIGSWDFGLFPDRLPFTQYSHSSDINNNEFLLHLLWRF
jgi:hypothetical protein